MFSHLDGATDDFLGDLTKQQFIRMLGIGLQTLVPWLSVAVRG
jgi:hypothetical protein